MNNYLLSLSLFALIFISTIQACEFRFWILGDTTYAGQGWEQMTIAELNTFRDEFVAQYNNDGGLQPIETYFSHNCIICQDSGLGAIGYSPTWSGANTVCPNDGTQNQWNLNLGTYYLFGWNSAHYNPLITTGTFTAGTFDCVGTTHHSIFKNCVIPTTNPTTDPTTDPTHAPTKMPTEPSTNPTNAPTTDSDDDDDDNEVKVSSSSSDDNVAAALFNENEELNGDDNNGATITVISLHVSNETMTNMWILFGVFTPTYIIFCFMCNKRKKSVAKIVDESSSMDNVHIQKF